MLVRGRGPWGPRPEAHSDFTASTCAVCGNRRLILMEHLVVAKCAVYWKLSPH